ncbi:aspartyl/glutamyl-tRNA(Asn/Gln) amidotransferase subunit B [Sinobacterium caligoides]|uniref:Aspartyl/glutamyl-tRNA(Asn/Gln) amidotransferase subunit B n=1 Tax=Sinobacterium caligoides TaxID=933926 RepID=A0A3N2DN63_9GAMM|nr:Asp-tRNA(Asn)/Glu-tRNA(Gln) amidotransferase subunit GatB [Sinobacterium caligoides]ROS01246.1 aspartyl/glutamyl-tRNA(Asn/Gln) amidotransferase subunit B [Sinobacterium caligoides]
MQWETVIGLEIHVQLATTTKIFSGSSTAFGAEPNTQASIVDLAMPGTLPVLNIQAVKYAAMFGLAIGAEINQRSTFDRKNYFYPDSPKGYQTTQMDAPIVGAGTVTIELSNGRTKEIRIHHAHLEEDAGKSLHDQFPGMSGIDLNRAGTPLIEIVSEPDMSSAEEAVAFARKIHAIVTSIGIGDGDMSQGSLRFDVNVSVRPKGQAEYGTRTETKNLNSFRFMERAIHQEVARQIDLIEDGGTITQETRLYDGDKHIAKPMRSKEEANDYRYFPCPDLLPVELDDSFVEALRNDMPELPDERKARYIGDFALSNYDADILSGDREQAVYFETVVAHCDDAKLAANWIMGELAAQINKADRSIGDSPISAEQLGGMIKLIKDGTISGKIAKQVFEALWSGEATDAKSYIEAKGLIQNSDEGAIEAMVDEVLANNPDQVAAFRAAEGPKQKKMTGFFVGQIMKASKGQANPGIINKILMKKLNS